jgi:cupin 2 domain-containing protein
LLRAQTCARPDAGQKAALRGNVAGQRRLKYRKRDSMQTGNLFTDAAVPKQGERVDTILSHRNLVIERIVSSAFIAPQEYRQAQDEWVLLVRGEALIEIEGQSVSLKSGDYLFLPADVPHTLAHSSEGAMWLAVHLHPSEPHRLANPPRQREAQGDHLALRANT